MDLATGKLLIDNIDDVGALSEYSELIYITANNRSMIYNLDIKSVCCELLDASELGRYSRFSEYGGFATILSDRKLHFISNEGVVGNAVNINQDDYRDVNKRLMTWAYLGEGLYQLVVGNSVGWSKMIGVVNTQGDVVIYADNIDRFIKGLAIASKNGKYGVIDKTGNCVVDFEYEKIEYRHQEKVYVAIKEGVYYEISNSGEILNAFSPNLDLYDGGE